MCPKYRSKQGTINLLIEGKQVNFNGISAIIQLCEQQWKQNMIAEEQHIQTVTYSDKVNYKFR